MNQLLNVSLVNQFFCQLHPTVIVEIMDHFRRRKSKSCVFGLLVGRKNRTSIEITEIINMIVYLDSKKNIVKI